MVADHTNVFLSGFSLTLTGIPRQIPNAPAPCFQIGARAKNVRVGVVSLPLANLEAQRKALDWKLLPVR